MSCVLCQRCDCMVDSDDDPDVFIDAGDVIACRSCRGDMDAAGELDVESNTTIKPWLAKEEAV